MKREDLIAKKTAIAEKTVQELVQSGDLKKLAEQTAHQIAKFFEAKCLNRLQTAKHVYAASREPQKHNVSQDYADYSEVVAAAYYAMYYIIHAYLAANYHIKLREDLRGVHAITHNLIVYYLVKTKKLAKHLYDEYVKTLQTTSAILTIEAFQEKAYTYAEKYRRSKEARETFTYNTTPTIEAYHAEHAITTAEEFINTIRQLLLK
jgi:uncharacterized protein (UPF0332 family)